MGFRIPKGNGQLLGLSSPLKTLRVTAAVYAAKKINNGTRATAAVNCIAPDWPVSL